MLTNGPDRLELFRALERVIGADPARTLMGQLPPRPWEHLATRDDLRSLEQRMDDRMLALEHRLLFFAMTGAICTAASLAFAAVRF